MILPDFSLQGRVAIVTGGSRGIGKAIALAFAEAGANVSVCSRTLSDVAEVADEIRQLGGRALAVAADITVRSDVENLVEQTAKEFHTIDILVNNAGLFLFGASLIETVDEDWDKVIDTDLRSCYMCSKVVGKIMVERQRGSIINVASGNAFKAKPERGAYAVAKAGVVHLTRLLAVELGPYNVRVNCIAPGWTKTSATMSLMRNPEYVRKTEMETPLRRLGEPEDCVGAAVFLSSDASSFITGQTMFVDGGYHVT